ncbi:hypothetical protein K435DRAFT_841290, partial [Dendrothele bispora CBS 962.96]
MALQLGKSVMGTGCPTFESPVRIYVFGRCNHLRTIGNHAIIVHGQNKDWMIRARFFGLEFHVGQAWWRNRRSSGSKRLHLGVQIPHDQIKTTKVQALILGRTVAAANSFAGANNYYAYGLPDTERHALLDAMKSAGMKVLRTWVSGHTAGQKGSNSAAVNDLEHDGLGTYDDAILKQIDQLMV